MTADGRRVIAVDFDGVVNDYRTWEGVDVFRDPVPGAVEAIRKLRELNYVVVLNTTRIITPALRLWLDFHGIVFDAYNEDPHTPTDHRSPTKILADIYIDDRAVRFNGDWSQTLKDVEEVVKNISWYHQSHHSHHLTGDCKHCGLRKDYWPTSPKCVAQK